MGRGKSGDEGRKRTRGAGARVWVGGVTTGSAGRRGRPSRVRAGRGGVGERRPVSMVHTENAPRARRRLVHCRPLTDVRRDRRRRQRPRLLPGQGPWGSFRRRYAPLARRPPGPLVLPSTRALPGSEPGRTFAPETRGSPPGLAGRLGRSNHHDPLREEERRPRFPPLRRTPRPPCSPPTWDSSEGTRSVGEHQLVRRNR